MGWERRVLSNGVEVWTRWRVESRRSALRGQKRGSGELVETKKGGGKVVGEERSEMGGARLSLPSSTEGLDQ